MKCNLWKLHNFTFCQKLDRQSCCLLWAFWLYQASSTCPLPRVFPQIGSYFLRGYDLLSFLWLICGGEDNQKLTAYHVVSEKLEFADLLSKASQSRLPTLLTNYSILVTNNSECGFAVDSVLITETDVFVDTFIAIDFMHLPLILKCMVKSNISLAAATLHLNQNGRFFPYARYSCGSHHLGDLYSFGLRF